MIDSILNKRNRPFRVIVSIVTVWAFLSSTLITDIAWAFKTEEKPQELFLNHAISLPSSLGRIKDRYTGTIGKTIIHIQDAHCNYSCQKSIAGIADYLTANYGVKTALLEG